MATTLFSNIVGQAQVVPVISPSPVAYTFAVPSNLGAGSGTNSAFGIQNVSKFQATLIFSKDATTGSGTGAVTFTMPAGLTIATSLLSGNKIGSATLYTTTTGFSSDVVALTSTTFAINKGSAAAGTRLQGADFTGGTQVLIVLDVPIVEYIANSYVAQGAGLMTTTRAGIAFAGQIPSILGAAIVYPNVGFTQEATQATSTSTAATGVFFDVVSLNLQPGKYALTGQAIGIHNSSTIANISAGISTTTGNSSAGMVAGISIFDAPPPTNTYNTQVTVADIIVTPTVATTYYLKMVAYFSAGTPQHRGRLTAKLIG